MTGDGADTAAETPDPLRSSRTGLRPGPPIPRCEDREGRFAFDAVAAWEVRFADLWEGLAVEGLRFGDSLDALRFDSF